MANILQEMKGKIKAALADRNLFVSGVLILVAVASFGLGRHSVGVKAPAVEPKPAIVTERASAATSAKPLPSTHYVASKKGQVYHLPHCSGAKNISEANKITFQSKEEAEVAGYRPAANCKGI